MSEGDLGSLLGGGRHAAFVWWSYAIGAATLGLLAIQSIFWSRRLKRQLAALEAAQGAPEAQETRR